jgi:predicted transposase YdaD
MREYETSKMAYRDIKNSVDTAKREGIAEGMEKGMELGMAKGKQEGLAEGMEKGMAKGMEKGMNQKALEIAKNMLAMGLSAEQVAKATQLPLEIIKNLSNS